MTQSRQWLLNDHPRGRPIADGDFKLVTANIGAPGEGEMLLKTHYLAFDPAQKGWMENVADYVAPMHIGDVMRGSAVVEVIESKNSKFSVGTMLAGTSIWSEYRVSNGEGLNPVEPGLPATAMLSILGTTGMTAWCGLFKIGRPIAGDVVIVSGAAGATGSLVGQLAKIAGCTTIGIAGGTEKCAWLIDEAGYDYAIDYKAGSIRDQIRTLAPGGANVIFDNVGGTILNDMLGHIATSARVVICGGISRYQTGTLPVGPENYFNLVFRRARMEGFIVIDWMNEFPAIRKRMAALINSNQLKYREDIQHGFENAPDTLKRLFTGANKGKQLLKLD
jgi:NADPH-dependent curcumin reductase CurA